MEHLLYLYSLPYDPKYPLICFDERPCFLIGETVQGFGPAPGQVRKEHYEYEKNGSCSLLMAVEPLTGKRLAIVYDRRRKIEYADFMQKLAALYPNAEKIRVIQDNLNTHSKSAFYQEFDAKTAFELSEKFDFSFTPKKASWLNAVETEFSAIARRCLNRRIPTKQELEQQVISYVKERQQKQIKISWKFSITDARRKMNRHYAKVNSENTKHKQT